jgi:hypothetical protein
MNGSEATIPEEPVRRPWSFGLKTLLAIVSLVCVALALFARDAQHARDQRRLVSQALVDSILVQHHWNGLEANQNWSPSRLSRDLTAGKKYRWSFFLPNSGNSSSQPKDPFGRTMVKKLPRNVPAVGAGAMINVESADRESEDGKTCYYYQAVRAKKSCVTCHRVIGKKPDPNLAVGDILAVVRVELPD